MLRSLVCIFFLNFLFGCQLERSPSSLSEETILPQLRIFKKEQKKLGVKELGLAYQVCMSYRSKSFEMKTQKIHTSFRHELTVKDCDGNSSSTVLETKLRLKEDKLYFESRNHEKIDFFNIMEDHQNGAMQVLCPAILAGDNIYTVLDSGEHIYSYHFKEFKENILLTISLSGKKKTLVRMDEFLISAGGKSIKRGIILEHKQSMKCHKREQVFSSLTQSLII